MNGLQRLTAIIAGCGSDIGHALAERWLSRHWLMGGTFRSGSTAVQSLAEQGMALTTCDFADRASVDEAGRKLPLMLPSWDVLVLCPATLEPIVPFCDCNFDEWQSSVEVNALHQLRFLHALLPSRNRHGGTFPTVLMFAGGGTNGAPPGFSAYTLSKIALIKSCELLDREMPDVKFTIIGPGWVQTKIHGETLRAGARAGATLQATRDHLKSGDFTPMEKVLDCCDWAVRSDRSIVSGRNFSVVHDRWGEEPLNGVLAGDPDMYKLRRAGNDALPRTGTL